MKHHKLSIFQEVLLILFLDNSKLNNLNQWFHYKYSMLNHKYCIFQKLLDKAKPENNKQRSQYLMAQYIQNKSCHIAKYKGKNQQKLDFHYLHLHLNHFFLKLIHILYYHLLLNKYFTILANRYHDNSNNFVHTTKFLNNLQLKLHQSKCETIRCPKFVRELPKNLFPIYNMANLFKLLQQQQPYCKIRLLSNLYNFHNCN